MKCRVCSKDVSNPYIVHIRNVPTPFCELRGKGSCWDKYLNSRVRYRSDRAVIVGFLESDSRAHFFQADDSGKGVKSLCGKLTGNLLDVMRGQNVTCDDCAIAIEGSLELEDVKMSGHEPEMSTEEYRRLFNLARTSNDITSELASDLESIKKTGKSFGDMTMEEKSDHIEFLNRMVRKIKVIKNSAALRKQEEMMELSEAEREKVRDYDRRYKPKPVGVESKSPGGPRKPAKTAEQKMIESLTQMLGSEEKARAYIESQKAGK